MKKCIAAIVLALCGMGIISANAQDMQAGFKLGANVSKIDGKALDQEFRFGYHIGFFARVDLSDQWGIQPELLWSSMRSKVGTSLDTLYSFNNITDISLDYLSVPLIVSYSPIKVLSFHAGPQFGILINPHETTLENGKEAFVSGDMSFLLGTQVNAGPIKAGLRYVIGLNNLNDIAVQDTWKSQNIQLYIGYTIF